MRSPAPHSLEDEAALLGAALVNDKAARLVAEATVAEDFYAPFHKKVRAAVCGLVAAGRPVDVQTVASEAARHNGQDVAGTKREVSQLLLACPAAANAEGYLDAVKDTARRRSYLALSRKLAEAARSSVDDWEAGVRTDLEGLTVEPRPALDHRRVAPGGTFLLADDPTPPVIHGRGAEVLHASGEATLVCALTGAGKSTYAQNYALHRLGLRPGEFIGYPVQPLPPGEGILYVAADRPRQIRRSFRRLIDDTDRDELDHRLVVWKGPPPFRLNQKPEALLAFVRAVEAHHGVMLREVILDSLKDVASELVKDEGGAGVAQALGHLVADDREALVLHHERKAERGAKKAPAEIGDVYGSQYLTACMGNVVYLHGPSGAHVVELIHLKQSAETVGPLLLDHDHDAGTLTVRAERDVLELLRAAPKGFTVRTACLVAWGLQDPDRNAVARMYRKLERYVAEGLATRPETAGGYDTAAVYYAVETRHGDRS